MSLGRSDVDERIVGGRPCPPFEALSRILAAELRTEDILTEIRDLLARPVSAATATIEPPAPKAAKPPKGG